MQFTLTIPLDGTRTYDDIAEALRVTADKIGHIGRGIGITPMPGHYPEGHGLRTVRDSNDNALGAWGVYENTPITVGVLVEAGTVTEIRATHPEITLILADADTQDEDAEKAYNESRDAFEQLPHIIFE